MSNGVIRIAGLCCVLIIAGWHPAEATFSIVAVDTVTGEIGGAGASCIDNSQIINDIIELIGAVHTQAYWLSQNQQNAHALLAAGLTPDSIISWLAANDAEGRPHLRQYGVVTLAGPGASAGYTGSSNTPWAEHVTGPGYAIQGNILLGPEIIDTMELTFLTTPGPLEDRLMATLEAAEVVGADTRCLTQGKSAISAFIKVVRPGDGPTPYLYKVVPSTTGSNDPIDSLRVLYDAWKLSQAADPDTSEITLLPEILHANGSDTALLTVTPLNAGGETPVRLDSVTIAHTGTGNLSALTDQGNGTFTATLVSPLQYGTDTITAGVGSYGLFIELSEHPVATYYACGNADNEVGPGGPVDVADLSYMVSYLFLFGPPPPVPEAANADGQLGPGGGLVDVADLSYMVAYLFFEGPPPVC